MNRIAALAALVLFGLVPTAAAVEPTGRGENIAPVKNIQFPKLHTEPDTPSLGTDLEFKTLTVGAKAAEKSTKCTTKKVKAKKGSKKKPKKRKVCRIDIKPAIPGVQRTFAFAGSYKDGLMIVDVSDPANATPVATWDCGVSQGDVQLFTRPDLGNRTFAVYTHDDGYDFEQSSKCAGELKALGFDLESAAYTGTYIADVTNPYAPVSVAFIPIAQGSHNQSVHPSGRYLYNSNSDLITSLMPAVEITDISDPAHPKPAGEVALATLPGLGTESHDISFSADGTRAYVAALSHGEILDTSNPAKPVSIGQIFDLTLNVWHQVETVTVDDPLLGEREFLIAEDEAAGATGLGICPTGGVHVFDITGELERTPIKVGFWDIDEIGPTEDTDLASGDLGRCTAHVFQVHREEKLMTLAAYNGGVRVLDISALVGVALGKTGFGIKQLGFYRFPDSDTWSAKATAPSRKGYYIYANDHRRGFDVLKYTPGSSARGGEWLTPERHLTRIRRARARGIKPVLTALCLLEVRGARGAARRAGLRASR